MNSVDFVAGVRRGRLSVDQAVVERLSRIADRLEVTLTSLGGEPNLAIPARADVGSPGPQVDYIEDVGSLLALAKEAYAERRAREQTLPAHLFGEPGWDILLDLFIAKLAGKEISVTSSCIAASVPPTTALRWIDLLISDALAERVADEFDRRRSFLRITDRGYQAVRGYFLTIPRGKKWAFREIQSARRPSQRK